MHSTQKGHYKKGDEETCLVTSGYVESRISSRLKDEVRGWR